MKSKKQSRLVILPQRDMTPLDYAVFLIGQDNKKELIGTIKATSQNEASEIVAQTYPINQLYYVEFVPKH